MAHVPPGVVQFQQPILISQLLIKETCSRSSSLKDWFRKSPVMNAFRNRHITSHTLNKQMPRTPGLPGPYHPLPVTFHSRKNNTRLLSLKVATLQTNHRKDDMQTPLSLISYADVTSSPWPLRVAHVLTTAATSTSFLKVLNLIIIGPAIEIACRPTASPRRFTAQPRAKHIYLDSILESTTSEHPLLASSVGPNVAIKKYNLRISNWYC